MKYTNLHAHSLSIGDSIGFPGEHIDFAIENGLDAHAFTDHGTMSNLSYAFLHQKKLKEKGKDFKVIYGVEAYFVPSLFQWSVEYDLHKLSKKQKKSEEAEEESSVVIEDEEETKSAEISQNTINRRAHLVLLAKNEIGLKNLFKLVSKSYQKGNFYRFPRIDFEMLREHSEGIICSTACLGSSLAVFSGFYDESKSEGSIVDSQVDLINKFKSIFSDRFFLELQWNAIPAQLKFNQQLVNLSKKCDVPLISTADCHYPRPELWKEREIYKAISRMQKGGKEVIIPNSINDLKYQIYPKNGLQMLEAFEQYSSAGDFDRDLIIQSIERTHDIAHRMVENFQVETRVKLPSFVIPEGREEDSLLEELALDGLEKRGLDQSKEYLDRLTEELDVIQSRKFSKYFLTMKAISDEAQSMQLVGAGRGSAAGSLLSYCLQITNIDPIKNGLQFSRFLRKDDKGWPDIDFDTSDPMILKEHLAKQWGEDSVVPISNFNALQLRSVVKDLSKFYGIPFQEVNDVTNKMFEEATPEAKRFHEITAGAYTPTYEECLKWSPSFKKFCEDHPSVSSSIKILQGNLKSISRHAGGLLLGENLSEQMPLISSGGTIQTPFAEGQNVRHLEPLGFIKFDILGLASLRMIEGCIRRILQKNGNQNPSFEDIKQWHEENLSEKNLNLSDQNVFKNVFHDGKWIGIFQFTEKGAQDFCRKSKPKSLNDLSAITSVYRPGPLAAKVTDLYVEAVENKNDIKFSHKEIEESLEETYGLLIYQEQIAKLASSIGKNISLDEGNLLRKLLTKKGTGSHNEELETIRLKFQEGALEKGFSEKEFQELWEKIIAFANYGFNKCLHPSTLILRRGDDFEHNPFHWKYIKIKNVKRGDYIWTKSGYCQVKDVIFGPEKELWESEIIVDAEEEPYSLLLRCSLDHKIETEFGMKPLHEILDKNLKILSEKGFAEIARSQSCGLSETVDLEIDSEDHSFYANGISVSNSHAVSYSFLSFQCAHLLTYHENEWIAAFLDKETENDENKSEAVNIIKSFGFKIEKPDINFSDGLCWKVEGKSAYPPLVAIKGLGEAAIREIMNCRPFKNIDDILFNPNLPAAKVNKKSIDALLRSSAMKRLIEDDGRFNHERHCWLSICALERPKTLKKMNELMQVFISEKNFGKEERIGNAMELLGLYPLEEAMGEKMIGRLQRSSIPGIFKMYSSENDIEGPTWLIPIAWEEKFTKTFKRYLLLKATDDSGKIVDCKVWQVPVGNEPELNRAYLANVKKDSWGVSLKRPEEWSLI